MAKFIKKIFHAKHATIDFFYVLILVSIAYRTRLYYKLYTSVVTPFSFAPSKFPLLALIGYIFYDILFAAMLAVLLYFLGRPLTRLQFEKANLWYSYYGKAVLLFLLFLVPVIYGAHLNLIFSLGVGLQYESLAEFAQGFSVAYFSRFMSISDVLFLFLPMTLWVLLYRSKPNMLPVKNAVFLFLVFLFAGLFTSAIFLRKTAIASELKLTPAIFSFIDVIKSWQSHDNTVSNLSQKKSVRLIAPAFVSNIKIKKNVRKVPFKRWNVIVVALESTGDRYAFDTHWGNDMPMPFLHKLSKEGLNLKNHYSPSNSSPRSVFALMSGIYPMPQVRFFAMRKDVRVPSMLSFLGKGYNSFLITPVTLAWYFPKNFLLNSGLQELYDYNSIPLAEFQPSWKLGRHEEDVATYLLTRMKEMPDPFFAMYVTFAPHWPYFVFDKKINLFKNVSKYVHPWIKKYYNNMYLQDLQLKRIYDYLKKSGRLKDTILVILGDHSEAFGQHPGNWTHAKSSFEENFRVPAIIYQPKLFKPRNEKRITTHIDILPTLLDAMNTEYNPKLFQGESLFQDKFRRKYIFLFGNENTLSILSNKKLKVQLSFKTGDCWAYDVKRDPNEKNKLTCDKYQKQKKLISRFRKYQTRLLEEYNDSITKGKKFYGEAHPLLEIKNLPSK